MYVASAKAIKTAQIIFHTVQNAQYITQDDESNEKRTSEIDDNNNKQNIWTEY